MSNRRILNLGCGNRIIENAVNHDVVLHRPEVDIAWNLNDMPWPWADESFDEICARAVLEHLNPDLVTTINECWRILTVGGICEVKLPHWKHAASWRDPTHRWQYEEHCFDYFDPRTDIGTKYSFYTPYKWHIVRGPELNNIQSSIIALLEKVA